MEISSKPFLLETFIAKMNAIDLKIILEFIK
jgi:hypothetical protein